MNTRGLLGLVASATLTGCSYNAPQGVNTPAKTPVARTYRSGLETSTTFTTPVREYGTPHSTIEFELGSDSGATQRFGFAGVVINGINHRYGANPFREKDELGFTLKPDTNERIVFIEASLKGDGLHPATARSEINELYVFSPVMNSEGKPAREFTYSVTDHVYGKKAEFSRPNLQDQTRGVMYENNTNIIMPDLHPVRINNEWYYTPLASDNDNSKSSFYLIPARGTEKGAERSTGAVFLRSPQGLYRGTRMTQAEYNQREETQRLAEEAEVATAKAEAAEEARTRELKKNNPGLIERVK